jgi:hypothetical protein
MVVGLVVISWLTSLNPYPFDFWLNQHHVIAAAIKYRVVSLLVGTVVAVIGYKAAPIVFSHISKVNNKQSLIILGSLVLFSIGIWEISRGQHTVLNCERSKNACVLVRAGVLWSKTEQFPLKTLEGAYIQVDGSGEDTVRRVALLTSQGEIPMTYQPYSLGFQGETARQINAFVEQLEQRSLQVYEDNRWESLFVGIMLLLTSIVVFGVGCIAYAG